jgi:hypothetical protein
MLLCVQTPTTWNGPLDGVSVSDSISDGSLCSLEVDRHSLWVGKEMAEVQEIHAHHGTSEWAVQEHVGHRYAAARLRPSISVIPTKDR